MKFINSTKEPINVRQKNIIGNYYWTWVEPSRIIELDESVGVKYGLEKYKEIILSDKEDVQSYKTKINTTEIETKFNKKTGTNKKIK